jgi:23S rRNA pseudouridine1911/1915/1917 synthase
VTFIADRAERLDKFLARMLPEHSRTKLVKLVEENQVLVKGKPPKPSLLLTPGDAVEVASEPEQTGVHNLDPVQMQLEIVYEDKDLLVVNKPRGLATHPAASLKEPSLVNALLGEHSLSTGSEPFRPGIVHRLDKDTTGLIMIAKTDFAHRRLAEQIAAKTAERRYAAVIHGELDQDAFRIDAPIARDRSFRLRMAIDPKGKSAITHVKKIGRVDAGAVVLVRLETGRTHQIRVHLSSIGHPVVGDPLYCSQRSRMPLQLHATFLSFNHPQTGERVSLFLAPPDDFVAAELVTRDLVNAWEPMTGANLR